VELVEGRNLPPKRRSGVASEHEHDGLLCGERGKLYALGFVELQEGEIGREVPRGEVAGSCAQPESLEGQDEKDGVWHVGHDTPKGFGRLPHRPPDKSRESEVEYEQHRDSANEPCLFLGCHREPTTPWSNILT